MSVLHPDGSSRKQPLPPADGLPLGGSDDAPTIISSNRARAIEMSAEQIHGRSLGHFQLIEAVGVGGMAAVIKAHDEQLGRTVALKILPAEMAVDPENITRFKHEARAAAKLDHENVARVYFCGEDQGLHFIAFEYVEGENLRTLLDRRGPLPVAEALSYMIQIARGLSHAAARGVVHRDIKPSNIIITPEGRAKIVDMGLARHLDGPVQGGVTQSGVTLGTFDYISPEQALEPRSADVRSDLYSLGCTFYHLLTGQPPVPEGTAARKLHFHQTCSPLDPRQLNPAITDEVAAILARLMAKDPNRRYQTPEALIADVEPLVERLSDLGPMPGPRRPAANPWSPAAVGLAAAAVAAALVVAVNGTQPPDLVADPLPPGMFQTPTTTTAPPTPERSTPRPVNEPNETVTPQPSKPAPAVSVRSAGTTAELLPLLRQSVAHIKLTGRRYDLSELLRGGTTGNASSPFAQGGPGLQFEGRELLLEAADPSRPPVILLTYTPLSAGADARWFALSLRSMGEISDVTVRDVRFVVDAAEADIPVAAIAAEGGVNLRVERCTFEQQRTDQARGAGALVCSAGGNGTGPKVEVRESAFGRGQSAIRISRLKHLSVKQCAFAPVAAVLRLEGGLSPSKYEVRFENCTAMLERGALVQADGPADCRVEVSESLVARADANSVGPTLIRLTGSVPSRVSYAAMRNGSERSLAANGYYGLGAVWSDETRPDAPKRALTFDDCQRLALPVQESPATELPVSPWQDAQPTQVLANDPARAFRLALGQARLRLPAERFGEARGVLGVTQCVDWSTLYSSEDLQRPAADYDTERIRVVDPSRPPAPVEGVYNRLDQAVADAQAGDEILIKKNGTLPVPSVEIKKDRADLTIRPFPGYRPILTLDPETREADATLFRIFDGRLHLRGVQVLLRPEDPDRYYSQSVATVVGGGRCELIDTVVTLDPPGGVRLSVFTLDDPENTIKMSPQARMVPSLSLQGSFVRGLGELLTVRSSRRFELRAEGSLVALDGSLAVIDRASKEPALLQASSLVLHDNTVWLTSHLLHLRGNRDDRRMSGLVATQLECHDNLFLPGGDSPEAFLQVDGVDSESQLKLLLAWKGDNNVYGQGYPAMIGLQTTPEAEMPLMPVKEDGWRQFTDEAALPFVRLNRPISVNDRVSGARPSDFRVSFPDLSPPVAAVGAVIDRLPTPFSEPR